MTTNAFKDIEKLETDFWDATRQQIAEANTYHQNEHTLTGKCDFVMVNQPFNESDWRPTGVFGEGH